MNYNETQHWYECQCGDIKSETVEDHKDGVPTCEEKGECSVCHQEYGTELGHVYGDWTSNGDGTHTGTCANNCGIPKTEGCSGGTPTCEDKPVCSACGAEHGEELGHDYGDWTSNGDGTHTGTCANECGVPKTENCNFVDGECTVCGEVYTVTYYFAGSEQVTQAELKVGNQITAIATAYGTEFIPELSIVDGNAVTVEGNTITAVAVGTSTVKATYTINGETVEKEYTVTVTFDNWEGDAVKYSTLDGKIYFDDQLSKAGIVSIVDATDDSIVYYDGSVVSNVPENTDSKNLTDYTKQSIVTLEDGSKYLIDVVSYTQVITKDTDLAVLVNNDGTKEEKAVVKGYYILGNDIERSGDFEGNKATYSYFAGVLDGDGHYIDLQLGTNGLLCGLHDGADIKNLAILINVPSTTKNAYILASTNLDLWGGRSAKITDVYCEVNVAPSANVGGKGATKFCDEGLASGIRYKNFIFNLASDIQGMAETGYTRGGAIYGYNNTSS
ncbi:MAG: hypothetical protein J6R83_03560, partial [Clostridia bacterium]|nr:hypothetical protein [Clostridia bacterium]